MVLSSEFGMAIAAMNETVIICKRLEQNQAY